MRKKQSGNSSFCSTMCSKHCCILSFIATISFGIADCIEVDEGVGVWDEPKRFDISRFPREKPIPDPSPEVRLSFSTCPVVGGWYIGAGTGARGLGIGTGGRPGNTGRYCVGKEDFEEEELDCERGIVHTLLL